MFKKLIATSQKTPSLYFKLLRLGLKHCLHLCLVIMSLLSVRMQDMQCH